MRHKNRNALPFSLKHCCFAILMLLVTSFFSTAAGADISTDVDNPFASYPSLLLDEEMLLITQHGTGSAADAFLPNSANFDNGDWKNLSDRHPSWTSRPRTYNDRIGDDMIIVRNNQNKAFLAQAWAEPSSAAAANPYIAVSITPVDQNGLKSEAASFSRPVGDGNGVALAAADFTGDGATELIAGYRGSGGSPGFLIAYASDDPEPVYQDISGVPNVHQSSGLRIAAGDVNGDGRTEVAALYVSTDGKLTAALFSVDEQLRISALGSTSLDTGPTNSRYYSTDNFDIAFADWNGTGNAMLLCGTYKDSDWSVQLRLLNVDLASMTFTTDLSQKISRSGEVEIARVRMKGADIDGDGIDELIAAFAHGMNIFVPPGVHLQVFYRTPYQEPPSGYASAYYPITYANLSDGKDFDLKTGSFTGKLYPSSATRTTSQPVVALRSSKNTRLMLFTMARSGDTASIHNPSTLDLGTSDAHHLVTGDLDADSMLLGTPTHITLANHVTPLLFLNEPPKHIDPDASGTVTNYSRFSEMFIQYAQSETESSETTNTLDVDSNLGGSLSVEAETGTNLEVVSASDKEKLTISASVGKKYDDIKKNFTSQSTSLTGQTNRDDFVLYRCHTIDIWRYPILGWQRVPVGGTSPGQTFYQVVIPRGNAEDEAVHLIAGRNVDWYHPFHMNGNVLSYPSAGAQIPGFSDSNLLSGLVTLDVGGGNSAKRTIEWSSSTSEESVKSLTVSMGLDFEAQFSAGITGKVLNESEKVTLDVHMDRRSTSSSASKTSVTKDNAFDVEVPSISSVLGYSITPLMYKTDGGVLKTPHLVGGISDQIPWTALYGSAPDPALNLPMIWMFQSVNHPTEDETWEWVDDETQNPYARKIRGIFFRDADGMDLGTALPLGDTATIAVRVHNFSLVNCPPTTVRLEAATYDPAANTTGTPFLLGTVQTPLIFKWGATSPNWEEITLDWDTSSLSKGNYRVFVTLNPDDAVSELPGRALDETFDNNQGWYDIFVYMKDSSTSTTAIQAISKGNSIISDGEFLNLRANSLTFSPHENNAFFEVNEPVTFLANIVNESSRAIRAISVFFFEGDPAAGGNAFAERKIPGILPGESYNLVLRHAFITPGMREVSIRIHPKPGETSLDDNTARILVPVRREGESSGGCSTGGGISPVLLLLAGLIPLLKRAGGIRKDS